MPSPAHTAKHAEPTSGPTASLRPIKPAAFGYDQARHLLWRAGFGGTPEQVHTLVTWGPVKAVDYLLEPQEVGYADGAAAEFRKDIIRPPNEEERRLIAGARRSRDENALARVRLLQMDRERDDRAQVRAMQKWWLTRMVESPCPLEEKMTLFWHGHFATSFRTIENSYHMYAQNELFRSHAVGNYGELMLAIIRDPAMLAYLDNNDSRKGKPNENLARELMELFSLGVGAYSEQDIKEGARALTGYTFYDDEFVFRERDHDQGMKRILGNSGAMNGEEFVRAILAQRACSRFMARKLYKFFAGDVPDDARATPEPQRRVIDELAGVLALNNYELKPLLRMLFLSEHFYDPAVMGEQIKSPVQLVVGAIRSLQTPVRELSVLLDAMDLMGQNVFFPPSVKGWDGGRSWVNTSTMFVRQNILAFLLTGRKPQGFDAMASVEKFDPSGLLATLAAGERGAETDPERVVSYLLRFTLGSCPQSARATLLEFCRGLGGQITPDTVTGMLLLITAMPEYQLC